MNALNITLAALLLAGAACKTTPKPAAPPPPGKTYVGAKIDAFGAT